MPSPPVLPAPLGTIPSSVHVLKPQATGSDKGPRGGRARLAGRRPALGLCTAQRCAHWDAGPGPCLPLPVSIHSTSLLSQDPGLLVTEQPTPGSSAVGAGSTVLRRAASSGDRVQNAPGDSKIYDSGSQSCPLGVSPCLALPASRGGGCSGEHGRWGWRGPEATCRGPRAVPDVRATCCGPATLHGPLGRASGLEWASLGLCPSLAWPEASPPNG